MRGGFILTRLFLSLLIAATLLPSFVFGQKRPGQPRAAACSGAWTGNVTYTRSQDVTDSKTTKRVSGRGEDKREFEMKFRYKASVAVLEDRSRPGSNTGKASIESNLTSTDKTTAREENSCDRGKTWKVMSGDFATKSETRGQASYQEANVSVGMNADGSYTVSVGLPPIQGLTSGSQTSSFSGQCTTKPGKNTTMPASPTSIQGQSMTTDGRHRVDPTDPNTLSGSWSQTSLGVTETISWNLERCGAPLRITDIQFEDMKFPTWNDWQEISEQTGTIDGNLVKIRAKVLNASGETKYADLRFKETYKGDRWDGARPDAPLAESARSFRIEANSEETVEMVWESSGYAWFDDGRPRLVQRIKAELEENGKKVDEKTENLKVSPKPLFLIAGIWSDANTFSAYQNYMTTVHSYGWKAFVYNDNILGTGEPRSVYDLADDLERRVRAAQSATNAWHIDMAAHSTGGLIARVFVHKFGGSSPDHRPLVKHLAMMGTPNLGIACNSSLESDFRGSPPQQLRSARELFPEEMQRFNQFVVNRNGAKFSALVGNSGSMLCALIIRGDGIVEVDSATAGVQDIMYTSDKHRDMVDAKNFGEFIRPRVLTGPKGTYPLMR